MGVTLKILLVDDEPEILEILSEFLSIREHEVTTANNGKQALDLVLAENEFDLVFSDIKMPEMDGLTFLEKVRNADIGLPVILISGQGDLDSSIRALQLGALDFIVKPVYLKSVEEALEKIENAIAAERESRFAIQHIKQQNLEMAFNSDLSQIRSVISFFNRHTHDICTSFELDGNKLAICLQECLTNAIIHGNFRIDSSLKEKDWSAFDDLIKQRQADENFGSKQVRVAFTHGPGELTFEVGDEGSGFDPASLPDPTRPESWLKLSGRGILFIRSYMDDVSWNPVGNVITMTKYLENDGN